jgi:hypothetical protein
LDVVEEKKKRGRRRWGKIFNLAEEKKDLWKCRRKIEREERRGEGI